MMEAPPMSENGGITRGFRARLKETLDQRGLRWLRAALMVISVVSAGRKSAPGPEVTAALNRVGFRWMPAWLFERSLMMQARGIDRVLYTGGAWFHRFGGVYVHVRVPGASLPTAMQLDDQTRETWEHHYTPKPGDIVLDAGAGVGTEVLRWSRLVGGSGRIIAVEANPRTFRILSKSCQLNGLSNVELQNVALSDISGTVEIEEADNHVAASTVTGSGTVTVSAVTLDELLDRSAIVELDFLKMNIEGAEVPALRGMKDAANKIHNLCVSCHDFRADRGHGEVFRTRAVVAHELEKMGFRVDPQAYDARPWVRDQVNAYR